VSTRLAESHKDIAGLIVMYQGSVAELSGLKVEHERITRCLSERYEADRDSKPTLGYHYGDYERGDVGNEQMPPLSVNFL